MENGPGPVDRGAAGIPQSYIFASKTTVFRGPIG